MSDVPRSLQSWVSTIQTVVLTADDLQLKKIFSQLTFCNINIISIGRTHSWRLPFKRLYSQLTFFNLKNSTRCIFSEEVEKRRLWVRPVCWMVDTQLCKLRGTSDTFVYYGLYWTKTTIWLLILSFTQNIVRACSMFYHEGYRSVTPLDAARVKQDDFS